MVDATDVRNRLVTLCLDLATAERKREEDPANRADYDRVVEFYQEAIDTTALLLHHAIEPHHMVNPQ